MTILQFPKPPAAVLWDMNGVLVDDEPLHEEGFRQVFGTRDISVTHEDYIQYFAGRSDRDGIARFMATHKLTENPSAVLAEKEASYAALSDEGLRPYRGVRETLEILTARDIPCAVVTGSLRSEALRVLQILGLKSFFKFIVCAEDVSHGKPNPEGYLKAAEVFDAQPKNTVVIEDSTYGVAAARAAGMYCIAVTNTRTAEELAAAQQIVQRITPDLFV